MFAKKVLDYIGDISQNGGIKKYIFASGRAQGIEAYDVDNHQRVIIKYKPLANISCISIRNNP